MSPGIVSIDNAVQEALGELRSTPSPAPTPAKVADPGRVTRPAATTPDLPAGSKSKGATKMSGNDMEVFTKAVQSGMSVPDAMADMLKQRAARHATKYGEAKQAAADRKGAVQTLFDIMKKGSH